jgi:predicted CXXCH cytochrome family protein
MNRPGIILTILLLTTTALAQDGTEGAALCLGCHDFGPDSSVHAVLAGSHGISGEAEDMAGRSGCQDCHGGSAEHAQAPTRVAPAVSFGPRWTATTAAQDGQCLTCHETNIAAHWQDSLHMLNNLTCVTCHDVHAEEDQALFPEEQAEVCTVCHKAQKQGIHGLEDMVDMNPPCATCHNPHDHGSAETKMLENGSEGCRSCHNLQRMAKSNRVSDRAKKNHQAMDDPDWTCLECHDGVAHAPTNAVTAMEPTAVSRKEITLFYPGMAASDWLVQNHPGSQPLRQGRNCQQCHRGEEASMGAAQANGFEPAFRAVDIAFGVDADDMLITLHWIGPEGDSDISFMWGDGGNEAFRRGACFAACHDDLPGMARDRGQQTGKYLWSSRSQQQQVGQPSIIKAEAALAELMAAGEFVELWRIQLASGRVEVASVLADVAWQSKNLIQINKSYSDGAWNVAIRVPLNNTQSLHPFNREGKHTFGIALHGANNPGGRHWVSLPMTLDFAGDETDFKVEQ